MSEYNKYNECDECPIIEDKLKLLGQKRELKKVLNKIKKLVNSKDCNCNNSPLNYMRLINTVCTYIVLN